MATANLTSYLVEAFAECGFNAEPLRLGNYQAAHAAWWQEGRKIDAAVYSNDRGRSMKAVGVPEDVLRVFVAMAGDVRVAVPPAPVPAPASAPTAPPRDQPVARRCHVRMEEAWKFCPICGKEVAK